MATPRLNRRVAIVAVALGLLAGASPAPADTGSATVVGTGSISPGLPAQGCTSGQSVSFDGTVVHAAATYSVHFDGSSSICESLSAGAGSGTLSGGVTGSVNYTRTGNVVQLSGNVVMGGTAHSISGCVCVWVPTSVFPTITYTMVCVLHLS